MSIDCKKIRPQLLIRCVILAVLLLPVCRGISEGGDLPQKSPADALIFIDPGHGGRDTGACGTGGTNEKDITLQLSRLVFERLSGKFRTALSRGEDCDLDAISRTNMANEAKAALFISLHAGGSFSRQPDGIAVYHYEVPAKRIFSSKGAVDQVLDPADQQEPWRLIQVKFLSASKQLARFFRNSLAPFSTGETQVFGADALVLAGANMPAVLIEVGGMSDPLEEKKLRDEAYLARLADAIQAAVADYFGNNASISSMDLHQ